MRPARFALAILFGAAVLITFLKILFFVAFAAAAIGAVFLTFRALRYALIGWEQSRAAGRDFGPQRWPGQWQDRYAPALPLDPRSSADFSMFEKRPVGRIVEVF